MRGCGVGLFRARRRTCRDRRGRCPPARGHQSPARLRPASRWSRRPATPRSSCGAPWATTPTSWSSTSRCRPDNEDDGLRAAHELRRQRPETGVLVLSQYFEEHYVVELIGEHPEGVGYLLKERVGRRRGVHRRGQSRRRRRQRARPRGRRADAGTPARRGPARPAQPARARRPRGDGGGKVEPGHRRVAGRHPGRGREARDQHLPEARTRPRPRPSTAGCSRC